MDCYDPETRLFPDIAKKISGLGALTEEDVWLILKWKQNRIQKYFGDTVCNKNLAKINKAVRDASHKGSELDALRDLDKVKGINLPTATAILTVCYPKRFTILDYRVAEMLNVRPTGKNWTAEDYTGVYLPK